MVLSRKTIVVGLVSVFTLFSIYLLRFTSNQVIQRDHALGITGALLMIQTEVFYTWRKNKLIKFGSPKRWLQAHIITGLLGPTLILWHANWNFSGFAGLVTYLTLAVTLSGMFGRYIYRLIPRTARGDEESAEELGDELFRLAEQLRLALADRPEILAEITALETIAPRGKGITALWDAAIDYYRSRARLRRKLAEIGARNTPAHRHLEEIAFNRLALERKRVALSTSKNLLSNWRKLHKPLTLTLFYAIGVHIMAILYYGRSY